MGALVFALIHDPFLIIFRCHHTLLRPVLRPKQSMATCAADESADLPLFRHSSIHSFDTRKHAFIFKPPFVIATQAVIDFQDY
jgi:hypothetical protein